MGGAPLAVVGSDDVAGVGAAEAVHAARPDQQHFGAVIHRGWPSVGRPLLRLPGSIGEDRPGNGGHHDVHEARCGSQGTDTVRGPSAAQQGNIKRVPCRRILSP